MSPTCPGCGRPARPGTYPDRAGDEWWCQGCLTARCSAAVAALGRPVGGSPQPPPDELELVW